MNLILSQKRFQKEDDYIIPKNFITHLTVLTIGTARGILHAKLEKSGFEKFLLPTLNISDIIKDDLIIKSEPK